MTTVRCVSIDTSTGKKHKTSNVDVTDIGVVHSKIVKTSNGDFCLRGDIWSYNKTMFDWMKEELGIDKILIMNNSNERKIRRNNIKDLGATIYEGTKPRLREYRNTYLRMMLNMPLFRGFFEFMNKRPKNTTNAEKAHLIYDDILKRGDLIYYDVATYVPDMHYESPRDAIMDDLTVMYELQRDIEKIINDHYPLLRGKFRGRVDEVEYIRAIDLYHLIEDI